MRRTLLGGFGLSLAMLCWFGCGGGGQTTHTSSGGGNDGGAGGGSSGECKTSADCPTAEPCSASACTDGMCGYMPSPAGTACPQGTCDASGACVMCRHDDDCTAMMPNTECGSERCISGGCEFMLAQEGTPCSTGTCTDTGQCMAQCMTNMDCTSATACNVPACVQGVCVETPAADGTMCLWNDAPLGTCNTGSCQVCQSMSCDTIDMHEPNDTQDTAFDLGAHTDCDNYAFCAALTPGDVDWYTYAGSDTFGCNVAPTVNFDDPDIEVCQYWSCNTVPTLSTCPDGTTVSTAPGGQPGCCGTSSWNYDPCDGGLFDSEDATIWIKVERHSGTTCTPYALDVEF